MANTQQERSQMLYNQHRQILKRARDEELLGNIDESVRLSEKAEALWSKIVQRESEQGHS
ncbi:hypothetical protein [Thalassotalea aquiviva]|uniref:hypothetical protein n=1 Tax=Thalassotalea aquiviva TaxID=3242415 RepID=UPI00352BA5A2